VAAEKAAKGAQRGDFCRNRKAFTRTQGSLPPEICAIAHFADIPHYTPNPTCLSREFENFLRKLRFF
jgi:hypothetical protein